MTRNNDAKTGIGGPAPDDMRSREYGPLAKVDAVANKWTLKRHLSNNVYGINP